MIENCKVCILRERIEWQRKKWKCLGQTNTWAMRHMEDYEFVYPPKFYYVPAIRDSILLRYGCVADDALIVLNSRRGEIRCTLFTGMLCGIEIKMLRSLLVWCRANGKICSDEFRPSSPSVRWSCLSCFVQIFHTTKYTIKNGLSLFHNN